MAGCDYRSCDVCDSKAYYDASVDYDFKQYPDTGLWNCGDWAVLCRDCSKKFEVVIKEKIGYEVSD